MGERIPKDYWSKDWAQVSEMSSLWITAQQT